jgi:hypothetical protein
MNGLQKQLKQLAAQATAAASIITHSTSSTGGGAIQTATAWQAEQNELLQVVLTCCLAEPAGLQLQCLDGMAAWSALAASAAAAGNVATPAMDNSCQDSSMCRASSIPGAAAANGGFGPVSAAAAAWLTEARQVKEQLLRKLLRVHQRAGNEELLMDAVSRWPDVGMQRKLLERRGCWRQLAGLERRLGNTVRAAQVRR